MKKLRVLARPICQTIAFFALISFVVVDRASGQEPVLSENLMPPGTTAWVSVPDARAMKEAIEKTQFGAMMNDPNVKPFVDDLMRQFRGYLDGQNIRFGMKLSDIEEVHSGEICLAGVLKEPPEGSGEGVSPEHAIVLLVDVSGSEEKAEDLLARVTVELTAREATEEKITVHDIEASKWSFKKPQGLQQRQYAFHGLAGGWLVATDNEGTFNDVIGRITEKVEGTTSLVDNEGFKKVFDKCQFESLGYESHVRWFIEPFGYVQLAQAIADAQAVNDGAHNNIAEKFEEEGFSAIKGVGGVVAFDTEDHEAAHRTFVYAPPVPEAEGDDRYLRAAAMLDFRNTDASPLNPPEWVPDDAAGYMTFTWDLQKALDKVGYIIDKTSGTEGSFARALESIKTDPQGPMVDVKELISRLNNRISVCSVTQVPIDDESERIVFGIRIHRDEEFVEDAIFRLVRNDAAIEDFEGTRIMIVDTAEVSEPEFDIEGDFDDEFGGDPLSDDEPAEEDEDELKPAKPLFEKRVFVVKNGYLLIGNNVEQIKSIITNMPETPGVDLAQAGDYMRVSKALEALAGSTAPSFRHFSRMDKTVRTNYEMMRQGRMGQSKTVLAQLINRAYTTDETPEDFVREQELDGSSMPEDFEGQVAKYFGPTGLVVHSLDEGWLITGVILPKMSEEMKTASDPEEDLASDN